MPNIVFELRIALTEEGGVMLGGGIQETANCLLALEKARLAIMDYHQKHLDSQSPIVLAKGKLPPVPPNRG